MDNGGEDLGTSPVIIDILNKAEGGNEYDLFTYYTKEDLLDTVKYLDLETAGSKSDLIGRLIDYYSGIREEPVSTAQEVDLRENEDLFGDDSSSPEAASAAPAAAAAAAAAPAPAAAPLPPIPSTSIMSQMTRSRLSNRVQQLAELQMLQEQESMLRQRIAIEEELSRSRICQLFQDWSTYAQTYNPPTVSDDQSCQYLIASFDPRPFQQITGPYPSVSTALTQLTEPLAVAANDNSPVRIALICREGPVEIALVVIDPLLIFFSSWFKSTPQYPEFRRYDAEVLATCPPARR